MDLSMPPCVNHPEEFSSLDINDHLMARNICNNECKVREWCYGELEKALKMSAVNHAASPQGTWAGCYVTSGGRIIRLVGEAKRAAEAAANIERIKANRKGK